MKEILKVELETEFRRFIELENFTALVLVHPDDLNSVVEFVINMEDYATLGIHWISTYNKFVFKESQLYVKVIGESPDWYVRSCSGLLLSSAIIDVECFGREGERFNEYISNILFIQSRLHSNYGMNRLVII